MEKIKNRDKFLTSFEKLYKKKVEINKELICALRNHIYFRRSMETILVSTYQILQFLQLNITSRALFHFIKNFGDENIQKVFILLQFTRYKSTCEELIDLLRSTGQLMLQTNWKC